MLSHFKVRLALQISVLVLAAGAIFCNTLANDFGWDDIALIKERLYIRDCRNIPLLFTPRYWNELNHVTGESLRPVRTASLALDYFLWKLNPTGYRVTNLSLHIINVLLIFYLVSLIAGAGEERPEPHSPRAYLFISLPFLTAFFFATHPIHTESVNLIKNRSDLLAFLFFMLSLLLFIKNLSGAGRMSRRGLLLFGAWFCFIPALLSKEMAVTLPAAAGWYAICFMSGPSRKRALIRIVPYGVILIAYFWYRHAFIHPAAPAPAVFYRPADIGQHILTVVKTLGWYLRMLAVPFPLNLEHAFHLPRSAATPAVLASLAALLLLFGLAVRTYKGSRMVLFATGWIFLTLLPAANIVYLASRPVAEQRLYIPSFGFCLLLAYGLKRLSRIRSKLLNPSRAFIVSAMLAGVIISLYALITVRRNFDWRDEITLYYKTLTINPNGVRVHFYLGNALNAAEKYQEAISHYQTVLGLDPDHIASHYNLGLALYKTGRYEEAISHYQAVLHERATSHYQAVLRLEPDNAAAHYNLGLALYKAGRYEEAIGHYQTVLRPEPDNAGAHYNLGLALYQAGRHEEAISHYQAVLRLEPDNADALNNLGVAFYGMGRLEEACGYFQDVLKVAPDDVNANYNMGNILVDMGRPQEAISYYLTVLRLEPSGAETHNKLGLALAAASRLEEAVSHYETALRLEPDNAAAHNNLGEALAKTGRLEEAVSHYFDAVRLQPDYARPLNNLGLAMAAAGQAPEAIGYYQAALKIRPDDAEICYNLGAAYALQGNYQEASALLARSLLISPDNIKAQQAYRECRENMKESAGIEVK